LSAAGPHPAPQGPAVCLPRSAWWDMPAGGNPERPRRILLGWPPEPPPPAGYPALLLLDGNATFATALDAYRALRARNGARPAPALLVGIGHGGEGPYDRAARARDYTPAVPGMAPGSGGADAFLSFIEEALLPALRARFPVDPASLALFGHSFGGLLATHALLARPGLFRRVVAASPSLWWGDGAVADRARAFAAAPPPAAAGTELLVTVGSREEEDDGSPRGAVRAARRMGRRARELAATMQGCLRRVEFAEFAGEDHGSVRPAAIARGLGFALPWPNAGSEHAA